MTEVLLEELSDSDINWMVANGRQQELAPGSVLIEQQRDVDALYIVLDGTLVATIARNQGGVMGRVFAALEDDQDLEQEIARFSSGEVLGELSFLGLSASSTTVKATERSVVLAVPRQRLLDKFEEDLGFASRFYRAIAILLLGRFERLIKLYLRRKSAQQIPPLQDIPVIFGELNDSDVDWMVEHSQINGVAAGTVLIRAGRPVENLYVLLEGTLSVSVSETRRSALTRAFLLLENNAPTETEESLGREIARSSRGEIIGETALLDSRLSTSTVTALENSMLLVVPRQQLLIKLQQSLGMSTRFYRVIAMLLAGRLQGLISRLGYGRDTYSGINQALSSDVQYEDEIDLEVMDNITLGGARFDWMLRRLKVRGA